MPIYIVMRLERHGNRLYGFMGLLSKKWDWIEWSGVDGMDGWYPWDCYDYKSTCGATKLTSCGFLQTGEYLQRFEATNAVEQYCIFWDAERLFQRPIWLLTTEEIGFLIYVVCSTRTIWDLYTTNVMINDDIWSVLITMRHNMYVPYDTFPLTQTTFWSMELHATHQPLDFADCLNLRPGNSVCNPLSMEGCTS